MSRFSRASISAVLGPTNTGKTHLAVDRLCGHSSGMIGFPLRLLAREVYDRVVAIKGPKEVGLITGEEKILPPNARWLLCTAESMPVDRDMAFVALDEAQLGQDPERGHVFTDRLLRARGREETMILGSHTLKPLVRHLVPEAEIITRPRFSRLSYAGAKKLSRLPPRTAIVAFSADQVYAIAEMLRRTQGGAAVVMGSLSPSTRNAQVALYQAGEVDYLVATDAIGMGLNMDVGHVAFAGLTKFDGKRQRRLSLAEIAQIAGRAGRHQRDGTFGTVAGGDAPPEFSDVEIERLENHEFPPIDRLFWRNPELDFTSPEDLIASLEVMPTDPRLRAAPEALDLSVLKLMSRNIIVNERITRPAHVERLWQLCGLPDFRKVGAEHHAGLLGQLFPWVHDGHIPADFFAREIAKLDNVQGDVDTVAARIASIRTWAYVAHRRDWLADPAHWAGRTAEIEEKLSDALHRKLTERFIDRRASVLMRSVNGPKGLDVEVDSDGTVRVEDEAIGILEGFRFSTAPDARLGEKRKLLAAAEARLPLELARRAKALSEAGDAAIHLSMSPRQPVALIWQGQELARLVPGRRLEKPDIRLEMSIRRLPENDRSLVEARLKRWIATRISQRLSALCRIATASEASGSSPTLRAVLAVLAANGGIAERAEIDVSLRVLSADDRRQLKQLGVEIGTLDLFHPALIKPEAARLRLALDAARFEHPMPPVPMPGLGLLDRPDRALSEAAKKAGYRQFGDQMLRVDLVERIARKAHDARGSARDFTPDARLGSELGVGEATLARILKALGFTQIGQGADISWRWQGRQRNPRRSAPSRPDNPAFAALSKLQTK